MIRYRVRIGALACGAAAVALAACGSSGSSSGGSSGSKSVTIGVSEMLTGSSATYGQAVLKGIQLAAQELNASGGVRGKKVVLSVADNASDDAQAVNIMRKYGQDSSIPVGVPPTYQPNFEASCAVVNQIGLPVVSAESAPPLAKQNPRNYCFTATSPIEQQTKITIRLIADTYHVKSFALIHDQTNAYQSQFDQTMANYIKGQPNLTFLGDEGVNAGTADYGPQITQILQEHPDVVIPNLTTEDAATFIKQLRARGVKSMLISPDTNLTSNRLYALSGGAAAGLITANNQSPAIPGFAAFLKNFDAKYGTLQDPSYSGYGFDALKILAAAMTKANSTSDRPAIQKALTSMTHVCASICYTYDGHGGFLTPSLYFVRLTANGFVPVPALKAQQVPLGG